jgi:cation transport ATPase
VSKRKTVNQSKTSIHYQKPDNNQVSETKVEVFEITKSQQINTFNSDQIETPKSDCYQLNSITETLRIKSHQKIFVKKETKKSEKPQFLIKNRLKTIIFNPKKAKNYKNEADKKTYEDRHWLIKSALVILGVLAVFGILALLLYLSTFSTAFAIIFGVLLGIILLFILCFGQMLIILSIVYYVKIGSEYIFDVVMVISIVLALLLSLYLNVFLFGLVFTSVFTILSIIGLAFIIAEFFGWLLILLLILTDSL